MSLVLLLIPTQSLFNLLIIKPPNFLCNFVSPFNQKITIFYCLKTSKKTNFTEIKSNKNKIVFFKSEKLDILTP